MSGQTYQAGRWGIALRRWVPYVLFTVACAVSAYAAFYVSSTAEERRRDQFFANAHEIRQRIDLRLDSYVEVVRDGTALLAASNEIHLGDFRAFVRRLELSDRYPGIEGIGFAQRVTQQQLRPFVRAMELDGAGLLQVHPAGERPIHDVVVFFEPMTPERSHVMGLDLAADPVQRAAIDRARDTGEPAVAGRASSPFNPASADGVTLYVPVYRSGAPVNTIEERRQAFYGFVFSPLRAGLLLEDAAAASLQPIAFEVYNGTDATPEHLMHASAEAPAEPEYESAGPLSIAGHTWLIVVKSTEPVLAVLPRPVRNTILFGLLFSLVLFVILRLQVAAWENAKRHEQELRTSAQALRASEARLREALAREQDARAEAQAADRAKDDFLVAASHELRTPITAILGWVSMLKTGAVRDDRRDHALSVIERNAQLQAKLVEDLLDVSRILLGRMAINLQPLAVTPVVEFVLESLRPAALTAGVELHPPAVAGTCAVHGDSGRVQQIIWNLVSNAIKFTPSGGHVFTSVTDDAEWVEISVRDTGIGMEPEFLARVFDRFSQADAATNTRARSGLGLGMAITRQLVEMHGGTIRVTSDGPNRGTTFIVRLPSAPETVAGDADSRGDYGTATPFASW